MLLSQASCSDSAPTIYVQPAHCLSGSTVHPEVYGIQMAVASWFGGLISSPVWSSEVWHCQGPKCDMAGGVRSMG